KVNIVFGKALGVLGHPQLQSAISCIAARQRFRRGPIEFSATIAESLYRHVRDRTPSIRRFPLAWRSISGVRQKEHFWLPAISDGSKLIVSHHPGGSQPNPLSEGAVR